MTPKTIIRRRGLAHTLAGFAPAVRRRDFLLTRQQRDAATAKEWGAVNEIVERDQLLDRAPSPAILQHCHR
jgi:enoyl-CoA hydratase/carnithine racemase